jgi:hypothetical protein
MGGAGHSVKNNDTWSKKLLPASHHINNRIMIKIISTVLLRIHFVLFIP